jgi:hypothetical protein
VTPARMWTKICGVGAERSQTRVPGAGSVNAVGGGFIPTLLMGGGAGYPAARKHERGGSA